MSSMSRRSVVVYTTSGPGQAAIVKNALTAAGIPAATSQEGAGAAYGLTVGPLGRVDILVPAQYAAEAEALLAAMRRGELDDEAADDADDTDTGAQNPE
jgi:Putative prokaryotic signal transducing protein